MIMIDSETRALVKTAYATTGMAAAIDVLRRKFKGIAADDDHVGKMVVQIVSWMSDEEMQHRVDAVRAQLNRKRGARKRKTKNGQCAV